MSCTPHHSSYGDWLPLLIQCLQVHGRAVRVVIAEVRGSAPRESGTSMIVTDASVQGTIGGGRLEWEALHAARALLQEGGPAVQLQKFVLGAELGQCCGGVVQLWLERHERDALSWLAEALSRSHGGPVELRSTWSSTSVQRRIVRAASVAERASLQTDAAGSTSLVELLEQPPVLWLYGGGHVGQAVLRIVAELPWQVTCIDSRAELLTGSSAANVHWHCAPDPVASVAQAPAGSCFLVMTHSHALDYQLVRAVLVRDSSWVGLIGSNSKAARFRAQLRRDGVSAAQIARLVCPIGIAGLHHKHPTAIAISVVAQLLQHLQDASLPLPQVASVASEPCAQSCSQCAGELPS